MLEPKRLVFLDETATNTKMVRTRGRCLRGKRLIAPVPHGHWKTLTLVAALRCDRMVAPMTTDGGMTGAMFRAYVEQVLAPKLRSKDIVMMDNLKAHEAPGVKQAIEARGATLQYLPKYSPDLNPIEMSFSKLKAFLRKQAKRTVPELRRAIAAFVPTLSATECRNYFSHAGYGST
jgi:transposase